MTGVQTCALPIYRARQSFDVLDESFIGAARPSVSGLMKNVGLRGLGPLWRAGPFSTLWSALGRHFHDERLRNSPLGYFVNNMTEGFGQMPSYAAQIPPADRWAIASYIRVLQYAENAQVADLDPAEKQKLDEAWKALETAKSPEAGEHGAEHEATEGEGSAH